MAKEAATMAFMEDSTAQGFSGGVSKIDFSWKVVKKEVSCLAPFLDGEPLDVDVTSPFGRFTMVHNLNA